MKEKKERGKGGTSEGGEGRRERRGNKDREGGRMSKGRRVRDTSDLCTAAGVRGQWNLRGAGTFHSSYQTPWNIRPQRPPDGSYGDQCGQSRQDEVHHRVSWLLYRDSLV